MAHVFNIVHGSTTITLGNALIDYAPSSPKSEDDERQADSFAVRVTQAQITTIQQAILRARSWDATRTGDPVYINFQPGSSGTTWQSRIYDGRVVLGQRALESDWVNAAFDITVIVERDAFWENAAAQIIATNTNTQNPLSDYHVYNCNDGIAAYGGTRINTLVFSAVSGDVKAPIGTLFQFTNSFNCIEPVILHIGHNSGATTDAVNLEGEASTAGGVVTAEANSSGGNYMAISLPNTTTTELFKWASVITYARREKQYKVFGFFHNTSNFTAGQVKFQIRYYLGAIKIWESELAYPASGYDIDALELGTIAFPSFLTSTVGTEGTFVIAAYQASGGALNVNLDRVMLMPVEGGYKKYEPYGFLATSAIPAVDNTKDGMIDPDLARHSGTINLIPGVVNHLHFVFQKAKALTSPTNAVLINSWYYPRRRTL